jgi:hypothetical protein
LNLALVICGTLVVVSIVLIALGMFLPEAQASLTADKSAYDGLKSVAANAANDRVIEDLRRKQNDNRRTVQNFLAAAAKSTPRTLLHPDVFPEPKEQFDAKEFKEDSDRKRRELLALLNAKDEPDQADIDDYKEQMDKAKAREMYLEGKTPAEGMIVPGAANPAIPAAVNRPGNPMGRTGNFMGTATQGMPENVTPEEWIKEDSHAGASVNRAHEIYCYANLQSLDPRSLIADADKYPSPEIMWEVQVSLWMQEDILQVLARINTDVANQLPEDQRWVGHLPIKHLLYIATGNYLKAAAAGDTPFSPTGGAVGGASPGTGNVSDPNPPPSVLSFTKRAVGETLDVVPVAVGLVIDANHLLRLLDEISKSGFYTTLNVNYEAVPYDSSLQGYIYGPAPVIRVRLELEHCILRDKLTIGDKKYLELMPVAIKTGAWVGPSRTGGPTTPSAPPRFMPGGRGGYPGPGPRGRENG